MKKLIPSPWACGLGWARGAAPRAGRLPQRRARRPRPQRAPAAPQRRRRRPRRSAAEAPHPRPWPNKGDTAWMLVSTLLVILMTIPGLALFYGGLVRSKNMLSVLMQVLVTFSLIVVLWVVYGYSLAFTEGNAFIGGSTGCS
jgi:Amt family ammonium transporter